MQVLHTHPNSVISGVLYLDKGEVAGGSESGQIAFQDPRPASPRSSPFPFFPPRATDGGNKDDAVHH